MSNVQHTYRCPVCQRVKDERQDGSVDQDWCTMAEYVSRHLAAEQELWLSEFYCTDCSISYDRLVRYSRASQSYFL